MFHRILGRVSRLYEDFILLRLIEKNRERYRGREGGREGGRERERESEK